MYNSDNDKTREIDTNVLSKRKSVIAGEEIILEEKDLTEDSLINLIDKTINNKEKLLDMKKNLRKLAVKDSSTRIYNILKELIMNDRKFY